MRVVPFPTKVTSFLVVLATTLASTSERYLASGQENAPTVPPSPSNDSAWLLVQDAKGKPVKQISLRKESTVWPLVLDKRRTALLPGATELRDRDGRYALPKDSVLISSPGFGSEWLSISGVGKVPGPRIVTLLPAATVTVWVLKADGRPLSGAAVAATKNDAKWPHSASSALAAPTSNTSGQVVLDSLSPGEYAFTATDRSLRAHRDAAVKVEPGKSYTARLRFRE